jgi:hypothetical protein
MRRSILAILTVVTMGAGLAGGLVYTWVLAPVEAYESPPNSLHIEDKFTYLAIIGDLYACEQDLELAEARLASLDIESDGAVLVGLIEQYLDSGGRPEDVRNLAHLAEALGASGGVLLVFAPVPTLSPSPPPALVPTSQAGAPSDAPPTPAATPTPIPTFRLQEQTTLCAEPGQAGQIAVWVQDAEGNGLAATEIVVSWATGQDRFFTGLRPEKGPGYADFEMRPQVEYEVTLADRKGDVAQGLTSDLAPGTCPAGTLALSWQLIFQQESD